MRFTARALGALAAAGILAVTIPGAAYAADGDLYIGKKRIENPSNSRCYPYNRGPIKNATDGIVVIYSGYGCKGRATVILLPYGSVLRAYGRSLAVFGYGALSTGIPRP